MLKMDWLQHSDLKYLFQSYESPNNNSHLSGALVFRCFSVLSTYRTPLVTLPCPPAQPLCEVARAASVPHLTNEPETQGSDLTEGRMAIRS